MFAKTIENFSKLFQTFDKFDDWIEQSSEVTLDLRALSNAIFSKMKDWTF